MSFHVVTTCKLRVYYFQFSIALRQRQPCQQVSNCTIFEILIRQEQKCIGAMFGLDTSCWS